MKEERLESCGLVFLYLTGRLEEGRGLSLRKIDSCQHLMDFSEQVRSLRAETAGKADMELFCILGRSGSVDRIVSAVGQQIQDNFQRILKEEDIELEREGLDFFAEEFCALVQEHVFCGKQVLYPRSYGQCFGDWEISGFWAGQSPEDSSHELIESVVGLWMEWEKPMLFGKQLMIQSFELRDLGGRRILGAVPDPGSRQWYLLLEGGRKVRMGEEIPYVREKAGFYDFGEVTAAAVDTVIHNPVYAYGEWFEPQELFEEWQKVFLYLAALSDRTWTPETAVPAYEKFLDFVRMYICQVQKVPAFLEKELFVKCLVKNIEKFREFLEGREEPVISKELLLLLQSRHVYIPYLWEALGAELPGAVCERKLPVYQPGKMKEFLERAGKGTVYEKGICWEKAAEYYIQQICGLRITGRRVRTGFQEIDLSAANVSLDGRLWEMGAYILIECKNWSGRIGIGVIRSLVHICAYKGNRTVFLFAANGITKDAGEEILRAALNQCFILCFTKQELMELRDAYECRQLL